MPYIKQEERGNMVQLLKGPRTPGQLNYLVSSLCLAYMRTANLEAGIPENGVTYTRINEVMGVLSCVQQEFYVKQARQYEDVKAIENGDLPWLRS